MGTDRKLNNWYEEEGEGVGVAAKYYNDAFTLNIGRVENDKRVWFGIHANGFEFDLIRTAVCVYDNGEVDFSAGASVQHLLDKPTYFAESEVVGTVIWHGEKKEGYGRMTKLAESEKMKVILYTSDYQVMHGVISLNGLGSILKKMM
jgi:hypothetical protein